MSDVLEVRTDGRLRVMRLNRPERKNALDRELIDALHRAFRDAAADDDVWAVALTGNGDGFCSGLDFSEQAVSGSGPASGDEAPPPRTGGGAHLTVVMRVECEKPILAAVNGVAVGAGVSLALNADIRIAAPSARFHPGYTRIGLSPDLGLTWTLPRAVGYERAMRFMLEQRMVPASEALALGLVSEVVGRDEDLDERLLEYGTILASVAPMAARQTKRLMVRADQPADLVAHLDSEIELVMRALGSQDSAEALRAMQAREDPKFSGR
ncbi:MAG: 2-(1,2-epoxy,2-dihydrophenyl)acetyl-CoA isomerase [Actinomycetota bacterium]|nr:2-(1,2-epoxy,2-dihydrophenyl)acetyl-CoA isomerase [Actinomycetota bacterium]